MDQRETGCRGCGQPFAADENYCPRCGVSISPEDRERAAGWETCSIRLQTVSTPLLRPWRWRFVAESRRPDRPIPVAESPVFAARTTVTKRTLIRLSYQSPSPSEAAHAARSALVQQLAEMGWEATTTHPGSSAWFAQLFRRRA